MSKVFHVYDGYLWWIVADDEADALEVCKSMDIGADDDFEELDMIEADPKEELTVSLVDGYYPSERHLYPTEPFFSDARWQVRASIAEWLTVHKRGDLISSSVY